MPITITVKPREFFDEVNNKFINVKETELVLEHSLISLKKWESKYKKPFLVEGNMSTPEEVVYYLQCMTISPQKVDKMVYYAIDNDTMNEILKYINDSMTATWFSEDKKPQNKRRRKEVQTAEVIYWQMIALEIPMECQKWHLNQLLTLIRVCAAKNEEQYGDKKKTNKADLMKRNAALNAQRKARLGTKG
jgi:hypothetical protein